MLVNLAQQFFFSFSTWVLFTQAALGWTPAQTGTGLAAAGIVTVEAEAPRPSPCV